MASTSSPLRSNRCSTNWHDTRTGRFIGGCASKIFRPRCSSRKARPNQHHRRGNVTQARLIRAMGLVQVEASANNWKLFRWSTSDLFRVRLIGKRKKKGGMEK